MSFLGEILSKRRGLNPADTTLTCLDGRKFLETKGVTVPLPTRCSGYVEDTAPDRTPARITEHIFLGSQDCCDPDVLDSNSIRQVLSVGIEAPVKHSQVQYHFVECLDLPETRLERVLEKCVPIIDKARGAGQNILVHCNAGVSRSPSIVIGYLIVRHNFNYLEAYQFVRSVRGCVKPNPGFQQQLCHIQRLGFS